MTRARAPVAVAWELGLRRPRGCTLALVRRAVRAALETGGPADFEGQLAIVFVGDARLAELHAQWLDDPTPTDVITFDLRGAGDGPAAELYVSVERAQLVARRRGLDPLRELVLYVVHGVLHLCGHADHAPRERRRMRAAERRAFERIGPLRSPRATRGRLQN